ncbi:MAG TPA: glycosyl hydrolase 115 family protein [Puia sp.]|nr:glycosyl hydrolase 115 family protein [Puia sp.]
MKQVTALTLLLSFCSCLLHGQDLITEKQQPGAFPIVAAGKATAIYVDTAAPWLVQKAAALFQQDIFNVTGRRPDILHQLPASAENLIIIGSPDSLQGKWEAFSIQVADHPVKGIAHALFIRGSDRRGTAYGVFELSRQMGVSPWYWWADVPVKKKTEVYVKKGIYQQGPPAIKYRGFFINDEAPAFSGWTKEKFGGVNHLVYEKVFELLLRLKANYLWPAMWGNAFNDDDTLNPVLADQYGIVMGTSHHEPMLRAQQEWKRYGSGDWNYETNAPVLDSFWKKGIVHMDHHESIVTVGMRGDGDKPMAESSNIALLEKIVHDQRNIIREVTGQAPEATPQSWALYKEVQDYYDKGMRVPDDITLLLCDDNWGNIRKLPATGAKARAGGYGIYYHFDYVGGPRNYKWINTNPIQRVWEQMHLAWSYGADRIWIVNVGDIKPMEFPTEFFMDYAWNPGKWPAAKLPGYTREWAARQFGPLHAEAIAQLLTGYTKYNGRRKPELLSPDTYSLLNYREAATVVEDYNKLAEKADSIYKLLPADYRDAYYQLVLYPVLAGANLNELMVTAARNRLYASQGRAATNELADRVKVLFQRDSTLSRYYNKEMAGGRWDHMMDQTHIGYTEWQQPPFNKIPDTKTLDQPQGPPGWGVAIEGSTAWWPEEKNPAVLPDIDVYGQKTTYIELFNRGQQPVDYTTTTGAPWLHLTPGKGTIRIQERIEVSVNWERAPHGKHQVPLTITGPEGRPIVVLAIVNNPLPPKISGTPKKAGSPKIAGVKGFIEGNGIVSIEAAHYTRAVETTIKWQVIPGLGRTISGVEAFPVTAPVQTPEGRSPRLEYALYLFDTGRVNVSLYCSPTLDFTGSGHLRYGLSFDGETPQIIDLARDNSQRTWEQAVADNIKIMVSQHHLSHTGWHTLKFWMVDPGIVLQKVVVDAGGLRPSYLGPPESLSLHDNTY